MKAKLIHENEVLGTIMTDRQLSVAEAAALLEIDVNAVAGEDPRYNLDEIKVVMETEKFVAVIYYNEIGGETTYRGVISDNPILPGNQAAPTGQFTPLCWTDRGARYYLKEMGADPAAVDAAPRVFGGI